MKKSVLAIMVGALCIILSSCQETPEESSVVSKVDGISEAAVCEPLKKGEKRETNVPTHWKFEEKKSNDRVVIQADIKLGEQSIGNLPVIEMQNHELTQEELNGLIDYFTDGEELYMPQMVTKDAYQEVLDRISSKEGSYLQSAYSTSIAGIQNATREGMELAPDDGRNAGDVVCSSLPSVGAERSNSILLTFILDVFFRWIVNLKLLPARTSAGSVVNPVTITRGTEPFPEAAPPSVLPPDSPL